MSQKINRKRQNHYLKSPSPTRMRKNLYDKSQTRGTESESCDVSDVQRHPDTQLDQPRLHGPDGRWGGACGGQLGHSGPSGEGGIRGQSSG